MRTSFFFFVFVSVILSITGCNKDTAGFTSTGTNSNPDPPDSTPPTAGAGFDVLVFLPADSCKINGWTAFHRRELESYKWRKISGPSSFKISNPDSLTISVNDLIKGVYEFELMVTDKMGLRDTDTVSVTVGQLATREIIFEKVSWDPDEQGILFGGSGLTLKNIYNYIPVGSVFKVYIMKIISVGWVEATGFRSSGLVDAQYTFSILDSNLYVSSKQEERNTVNIKIVY
jgi:hypothetical protein